METPALAQLMGAYLHQDFDAVGTVDENVDLFARNEPTLAAQLPAEVARVLATFTTEEALEELADALKWDVGPSEGDGGWRAWLTHIADHAKAALQAS